MNKIVKIQRLGTFAMDNNAKATSMVDFDVQCNVPIGINNPVRPDRLANGTNMEIPEELIKQFVKLHLYNSHISGWMSSSNASANQMLKDNFATYVNAVSSCQDFYGKILLQARKVYIDKLIQSGCLPSDKIEVNNFQCVIDGLFHRNCNHFLADHISALFVKKYDNCFHTLNRYLNGSYSTMQKMILTSNKNPATDLPEMPFQDNKNIYFENKCLEFLLGQNLLHCIVIANMNYTFGQAKMTNVFSQNWKNSAKILDELVDSFDTASFKTVNPAGTNPHVYFGRQLWAQFTAKTFCQRLTEMNGCNKAFYSMLLDTIKSDNKEHEARECMFNVYKDSFQLVSDMCSNDKLIDKIANDMADCFAVIAEGNKQ